MRLEIEDYLAQNSGEQAADPGVVAETFPYVLRQILVPRYAIDGQIRMSPQSGAMDNYGIFFWAHKTKPNFLPDPYKLTFVFETEELFERIKDADQNLLSKGIIVSPSKFYNLMYDRLIEDRGLSGIPTTAEYFAIGRKIYEDYMLLNLATLRIGPHPILTVPVPLTLNTTDIASSI